MKISSSILNICLASGLLLFGQGASATNYFKWNIENANIDYEYGVSNPVADTSEHTWNTSFSTDTAHSGSHSLKFVVTDTGDTGNQGSGFGIPQMKMPINIVPGQNIYYRWWMKIMPGFNWGNNPGSGARVKSARVLGGTYPRAWTGYLHADGFNIAECQDEGGNQPGGGCPGTDNTYTIHYNFPDDGQWHEYIVRIKPNSTPTTPDTEFEAYVDGVSVGSLNGWLLHDKPGNQWIEAWGAWMIYPYWQLGAVPSGGTIYVDDVSTDDTWNSTFGSAPGTGGGSSGGDLTPPSISSIQSSNIGQNDATISASTSEPSDFQVEYGKTTSYGQSTVLDTTLTTNHQQTLTGLSAGTTYHYRVKSRDAAGNLAVSADKSFTTTSTVTSSSSTDECANWQSAHPEWIWCDDFESATISTGQGGYFEYDNNGGEFVPLNGVGLNGSYGMRAKWQAGENNAGSLHLVFGRTPLGDRGIRNSENFRDLYYRVYVRTQAGWQGDPGKFSRALVFSGSDWSEAMIAHVWSPDSGGGMLAIDPVSCVNGSSVVCSGYNDFNNMTWLGRKDGTTQLFSTTNSNKWYCVESHVKLNDPGASNGIQEFWVNGTLEARSSNLDFVGSYTTYALNSVFLENFWNAGSPQQQERYFDNFVVSTQPIGCNQQPGLYPPMPPSNIN